MFATRHVCPTPIQQHL